MEPSKQGHRAAAQGTQEPNPFPQDSAAAREWQQAHDTVEAHRAVGFDPRGHEPGIPSTCIRSPLHVCNCCASCRTECKSEIASEAGPKSLLERVGWAVVRLVTAAELAARTTGIDVLSPCLTCGSVLSAHGMADKKTWFCVVCGSLR